jgi:hypothetical protein
LPSSFEFARRLRHRAGQAPWRWQGFVNGLRALPSVFIWLTHYLSPNQPAGKDSLTVKSKELAGKSKETYGNGAQSLGKHRQITLAGSEG